MEDKINKVKNLLSPGHTGCAGCGQLLAARLVLEACGEKTIVVNATGCLEVTTSQYPNSAWGVPWIHSLFENPAAVGSGILAALKYQGKEKEATILVQGGDGSTFDIGIGLISGMWSRGENILYVCYDNEAYMNTGYQSSSATPIDSSTSTAPASKKSAGNSYYKKDLPKIALAHGLKYVATTTIGYPRDIMAKVKKALTFIGPKYLQIMVPCVPGWGYNPAETVQLGKLAQASGIYPVFEAENGVIAKVMPVPKNRPKAEEFLKLQKRFKHLFSDNSHQTELAEIQRIADRNILEYRLVE